MSLIFRHSYLLLFFIFHLSCTPGDNPNQNGEEFTSNQNEDSNDKAKKREKTRIELLIDSDQLPDNAGGPPVQADQHVKIKDSRGGNSNQGDHSNFVTFITPDSLVYWKGLPTKATNNKIIVTDIKTKNNKTFNLIKDVTFVSDSGVVVAYAKNKYLAKKDNYLIHFIVISPEGDTSSYVIDPILKMVKN